MKKLKVLSLFNGMNCIGLALDKLGLNFQIYASEIDEDAIKVSDALFPNTINLGDVRGVNCDELPKFDLIVAGSPCQGFSYAGKQLNFEDERSKLFFEFIRILKEARAKNPNIKFLLENVKMKKQYQDVISKYLGIEPIFINSALVSAQSRPRLYWTNVGTIKSNLFGTEEIGIKPPIDKGIFLKDILDKNVSEKYTCDKRISSYVKDPMRLYKKFTAIDSPKAICMLARQYVSWGGNYVTIAAQRGRPNEENKNVQQLEIRKEPKSNCLTTVQKDNYLIQLSDLKNFGIEPTPKAILDNTKIRRLTPAECCRLQTIQDWAIDKILCCGVSENAIYKMCGNGWTVDVISYILQHEYKKAAP